MTCRSRRRYRFEVIALRRKWAALAFGLLFALPVGCAGERAEPQTPASAVPEPPPPKDAAEIAHEVAQARIGATLRVDRLRGHPAGERLVGLSRVAEIFEGTGIDVLRDASLVFVASTGITRRDTAVVVVQHELSEEQVRSATEVLMQRSGEAGQWLEGTEVPAARVSVRGHEHILAFPEPEIVVIMPAKLADQVDRFVGPLELPSFEGPHAVDAVVDQPSESLRAKHAPRVPQTISRAWIRLLLKPDGGLELESEGKSTTPEQAAADADALTRSVAKATSVKVGFINVRFFRKVPFRAEGERVKSEVKMSAREVARILSMAQMFANRR